MSVVAKRIRQGSLYVITDPGAQRGRGHVEVLSEAIRGGASLVQLRDKSATDAELIETGKVLREICNRYGALLIVNDRVNVAKAIGADGLHLGQDDLSMTDARHEMGEEGLIGVSTHHLEQALSAEDAGADYIGVGPIFRTPTKPGYPPVGIEFIRKVSQEIQIPFFAIGGIDLSNVEEVLAAGAHSVAVVRAVVAQKDIFDATQQFKKALEARRGLLEDKNE